MLLFLESIGTGEIVMVLLFVLIFFGADKIPGLARNLGKGIRQIKDVSQDFQDEIRKTSTEIRREANMNRENFNEAKRTLQAPVKEFTKDLENSGKDINNNIEGNKKQEVNQKGPRIQPKASKQPSQEGKPSAERKSTSQSNVKLDQQ